MNSMPNFLSLNYDVLAQILLKLKPKDYCKTCQVHPYILKLCKDPYFQHRYEDLWHLSLIKEFQNNPKMGLYWAGRLNSLRLFKYFLKNKKKQKDIYLAFQGAGFTGNRDFIQHIWTIVETTIEKEDLTNYNYDYIVRHYQNATLQGASLAGNWDYVERLLEEGANKNYILYGLAKSNDFEKFKKFLDKSNFDANDCDESGIILDTIGNNIITNSDQRFVYYFLKKYPENIRNILTKAVINYKLELYLDLQKKYNIDLDIYGLRGVILKCDISTLKFVLDSMIKNLNKKEIKNLYDILYESDHFSVSEGHLLNPEIIDLLVKYFRILPMDYIINIIELGQMDIFYQLFDYPNFQSLIKNNKMVLEALLSISIFISGRYPFVKELENKGIRLNNIIHTLKSLKYFYENIDPANLENLLEYTNYIEIIEPKELIEYLKITYPNLIDLVHEFYHLE